MAANFALALDEIIKAQKSPRGGGRGKRVVTRRAVGGTAGATTSARTRFPQRGFVSGDVPAGKWKHDKFMEVYGGAKKRAGGSSGVVKAVRGGSIGSRIAGKSGGGSNGMVKLQISNLPESVVTSDLEELFQDFNVFGVAVHYDEMGSHLGTADLFTDQPSATSILREFKNIAIDGQEIKFCLVTEGVNALAGAVGKVSIRDRLRRIGGSGTGGGVRKKPAVIRKRVATGPRKGVSAARGGAARRTGRPATSSSKSADKAKAKTAEELDMELEAYMKKL